MAIINGNNLNNVLNGTPVADQIYGQAGDDTLRGFAGNDLLDGGTGVDSLIGGLGDDTYYVTAGDGVTELAGAGTGNDHVRSNANDFTLSANVERLTLEGLRFVVESGVVKLLPAGVNGTGNALDNIIEGNSLANTLSGLAGNDTLRGFDGNDSLLGGSGDDFLDGGNGNDSLNGGIGNDSVIGGAGNDSLDGSVGNDALNGGAGDDTIIGGTGNDVIQGGTGADTLRGSSGNDVLRAVDNLPGNDGAVDRFVFDTPLNAATNVDTIQRANFIQFGAEAVDDEIVLENSVFTNLVNGGGGNLGTLNALQYFEGAGITGNGLLSAVGIYNDTTTGRLYYNPTGFGGGDSVLFAVVNNAGVPGGSASLSAEEFTLV